jgi:hypothetical protein
MRVDFVGHASLLVRQGNLSLLSDPWWSGPAYRDQWYPYPLPVPERFDLGRLDAVYISHSHEDHLHAATLRTLLAQAPDVEAIIPLRYDTQMRDYLTRIGFKRIKEVASGTPFTLRKGRDSLRLTVLTHMDDSLIGVEGSGEVLLNLNDALHSSRRELILEYCRILHGRFPRVDYLFCGFGGASYFPNCVHVPGKDDVAVARAREQFFLDNFALISHQLQPRLAFPFAAHFILPDDANWWMSAIRLEREAPSATLRRLLPNEPIAFYDLQPGDYVEDGHVHASAYAQPGPPEQARQAVRARYGPQPERPPLDAAGFDALLAEIRNRVAERSNSLDVALVLTDYLAQAIHVHGTSVEPVAPEDVDALGAQLVVQTRSDLIRSTLRSPFGKDLISIGYGGQFHLRSAADLSSAPHDRFLQLLAPTQPRWREHLRERPGRTLRFLVGDASMRLAAARRLLPRHDRTSTAERAPYDIRDWVAVPEG